LRRRGHELDLVVNRLSARLVMKPEPCIVLIREVRLAAMVANGLSSPSWVQPHEPEVHAPATSARFRTSEDAVRTSEPSTVVFFAPCQPLP
jgi:hypothetical protein